MCVDKMTHSIVKLTEIIIFAQKHNFLLSLLPHTLYFSINNGSIQFQVTIIGCNNHLFPLLMPSFNLLLRTSMLQIKGSLAMPVNFKGLFKTLAKLWRNLDVVFHEMQIKMNAIRMDIWWQIVINLDK